MKTKKCQIVVKSGENFAVFRQKWSIFTKMHFSENWFFRISYVENTAIGLKFGHNVQKDKGNKSTEADFLNLFFANFLFIGRYCTIILNIAQ